MTDDGSQIDLFQSNLCAERMKALADPHRLRIVDVLRQGERTVSNISECLSEELPNVSHHLKILKRAGIVKVRRDGRCMLYSLPEGIHSQDGEGREVIDLGCCRLQIPQNSSSET